MNKYEMGIFLSPPPPHFVINEMNLRGKSH